MSRTYFTHLQSPVGPLLVAGSEEGLSLIEFPRGDVAAEPEGDWTEGTRHLEGALRQLTEYFAGDLTEFHLELDPAGTEFQRAVWDALTDIPYGRTVSYRDVAHAIGRPRAVRAVGSANGSNPLPIVVPCHRVIGADGSLTGYGGGLDIKRHLLQLEGVLLA